MNFSFLKNWDTKRKIGFAQSIITLIALIILIPIFGIKFSWILPGAFVALILFYYDPVPLRKYSYLTFAFSVPMYLYFVYDPLTASFWILIFVFIVNLMMGEALFQSFVNASAYSLGILISGSLAGIISHNIWINALSLVIISYILMVGVFFYPIEFISRKTDRKEIIYILRWESLYFIFMGISSVLAYKITLEPSAVTISAFVAGFFLIRYYIRKISTEAIEGQTAQDLIRLQNRVMKRSLDDTLEAIENYSSQYIDWSSMNVGEIQGEELVVIYSTSDDVEIGKKTDINEGISAECIKSKEPVIVRDTRKRKNYIELHEEVRSEIIIPLISRDRVIGILDFESNLVGAFSDKEVQHGKFFANLLSYSLQTNRTLNPLIKTTDNLNNFTMRTEETTKNLEEEMTNIKDSIRKVKKGGEEQVESLESIDSIMNELLSSHENIREVRSRLSEGVEEFSSIIEKSKKSVEGNLKKLSGITESIGNVEETVKKLTEISGNIVEISESSGEIASDTSLLALNASIEAAREESGSEAFSVIADEINELSRTAAENSEEISANAEKITSLVSNLSDRTGKVVESTEAISSASSSIMKEFEVISSEIDRIREDIEESISLSEREISKIEQLDENVRNSVKVGEDNIDSINEISQLIGEESRIIGDLYRRIKELVSSVENLEEIVEEFKLTETEGISD